MMSTTKHAMIIGLVTFLLLPAAAFTQGEDEEAQPAETPPADEGAPDETPPAEEGAPEATPPAGEEAAGEEGAEGGEGETGEKSDEEAWLEGQEKHEIAPPEKSKGLEEERGKVYYSVGIRGRYHYVPKFFYSNYVVGAVDWHGYGTGIEATFRIKGLDIIVAYWYHDFYHDDAIMKEPGDVETEFELIQHNISLHMITIDFMNSHALLPWLYIYYGAGIGLGIPQERITRTEVYPERPGEYKKCPNEGYPSPDGNAAWCDEGGSYGENDPWPVYPYLNILLGLRFKPIPEFVINLDMGVGTGFIFGLRMAYVIN